MHIVTDPKIEEDIQHADCGFWKSVSRHVFPPAVISKLPRACDRFYEARHFVQLLRDLRPIEESFAQANWYIGAHLTAVIAIRDAGEADYRSVKSGSFYQTPLSREFYLNTDDPDASERDPMAINRNYKLLRNERVHRSRAVVCLEERVIAEDISLQTPARKRWFFYRITPDEHSAIRADLVAKTLDPNLVMPLALDRFNEYNEKRTLLAVAAQHLYALRGIIEKTAARLN